MVLEIDRLRGRLKFNSIRKWRSSGHWIYMPFLIPSLFTTRLELHRKQKGPKKDQFNYSRIQVKHGTPWIYLFPAIIVGHQTHLFTYQNYHTFIRKNNNNNLQITKENLIKKSQSYRDIVAIGVCVCVYVHISKGVVNFLFHVFILFY